MKKFISALLAAAISLMSSIVPLYASAENDNSDETAAVLCGLGLIRSETVSYGNITKGEFADIISKIYANDNFNYSSIQYFLDVPSSHKYAQAIDKLAVNGVILAVNQQRLYPDADITGFEAAAWLCRMLGYGMEGTIADYEDADYFSVAKKAGLLKNVNVGSDKLSYSDALKLIYNALDSEVVLTVVSGKKNTYTYSGESLMTRFMNIFTVKDTLYALGDKKLDASIPNASGQVMVGTTAADASDELMRKFDSLLGCRIKAYIREDSPDYSLVYAESISSTKSLVINAADVISATQTSVKYTDENGKVRTERFSSAPYIVYNNRPADGITPEELVFKSGYIRLAATDGGEYDCLAVNSYDTFVVSSVSKTGYTIYEKYGSDKIDGLDDEDSFVICDENGGAVSFDALKEWDVLSVAYSRTTPCFREIIVSRRQTIADISAIRKDDDGNNEYICGNEVYPLTENLRKYLGKSESSVFKNGAEMTVFLDFFGSIAAYRGISSKDYKFGIITRCWYKELRDPAQVKIFTQDGKMSTMELELLSGKRVRVNDSKMPVEDLIKKVNDADSPFLIQYIENGGIVKKIRMPEDSENSTFYCLYDASSSVEYRKADRSFSGRAVIAEDAQVFIVPTGVNADNDDYFFKKNASWFSNGTTYAKRLQLYATEPDKLEGTVAVYRQEAAGTISNTTEMAVFLGAITARKQGADSMVPAIRVWRGGKEQLLYGVDDLNTSSTKYLINNSGNSYTSSEAHEIKRGDTIRYASNGLGELTKIELVYDESERTFMGVDSSGNPLSMLGSSYTSYFRVNTGDVLQCDGKVIKMKTSAGTELHNLANVSNITVVDMEAERDGTIYAGTLDDIIPEKNSPGKYSYVIMRLKNGDPSSIIVYNYTR